MEQEKSRGRKTSQASVIAQMTVAVGMVIRLHLKRIFKADSGLWGDWLNLGDETWEFSILVSDK